MSRHEGVSCDSCLKGNFRGRRFKCLICYDYDLCEACYEGGATNTRHNIDHPMQCILTRSDFELFYGGEALTNGDQPQSYTCPYCSRMGFTDVTLQDHVTSEHADTSFEVVCPLCAALPGGDPNLMTDDFAGHLTLEHRTGPRDLISFLDEPVSTRHSTVRRIPHSAHLSGGRGGQSSRPRRSNMHFSVFSSGGLTSLSPSSRDSVDPIAELLSQLSGVRRSASNTNSTPSQLQQLQMQLQLERQQVNAARQQLERLPRRQNQGQNTVREAATSSPGYSLLMNPVSTCTQPSSSAPPAPAQTSNYLLDSLMEEISQQNSADSRPSKRGAFIEELTISSILEGFDIMSMNTDEITSVQTTTAATNTSCNTNTVSSQTPSISSGTGTGQTENAARAHSGVVRLRGRARSDGLNASRRAEANKVTSECSPKGDDNNTKTEVSR